MFASGNSREAEPFPPVDEATGDGIVAIGGELETERLLLAYSSGIFPWYEEGLPVLWWSPDPRAVLELDRLHVPRRLARTMRRPEFRVTFDRCFERVMRACSARRRDGTWITDAMIHAYVELHRLGHAHSVEVWHARDGSDGSDMANGELAGGIYGVSIGGFFAGESMFYRRRDASKIALVRLVEHLRASGFVLFDLQILNEHTARFGATEIPRREYMRRLRHAVDLPVRFA